MPLAQKVQPTSQPTWVLRQAVRREPAPGIITHSVVASSGQARSSLAVPSGACERVSSRPERTVNSAASRRRSAAGRSVISSAVAARRRNTQSRI